MGADDFSARFAPWLRDRVELSFGPDPRRHGTMFYGGASLLAAAEDFASTLPYAGRWPDEIRRFTDASQPFGHFFKVDWCDRRPVVLTAYARFKKGSTTAERLADAASDIGFAWPDACVRLRDALGEEPFLVGLRTAQDGVRQGAVYFALRPTYDELLREVVPTVAAAIGLESEHLPRIHADVEQLHDDESLARLGMEVGIHYTAGSADLRCTFYLREIPGDRACRFVESTGSGEAPRVADLAEALPRRRFLYAGMRYDGEGRRTGWKLYALVRPAVPLADLDPTGSPTAELLGKAFRAAPSGTVL